MITLSGYTITEAIYQDNKIIIYRGQRQSDQCPVVIKTLKTDYPTPKELARFRHEYEIVRELGLQRSVQVYDLQKQGNSLALVLEDVGGESLKTVISTKKLGLPLFLHFAIQLAKAVGELHQHNIIHKDLKPSNIIVNLTNQVVKLTDFSIASRLLVENHQAVNNSPEKLEGTLAYMSPEQTGRMNRPLDYRSDFYSLGVTLYELLVGWLPFQNNDPMELIHCHIAKLPTPPHELNPDIPKPISAIIIKLLAKNAEERYQSAYGLVKDLQHCLDDLQKNGTIKNFSLAEDDIVEKFQLSPKLYGRDAEIATLMEHFDRAKESHKSIIQVCGEAGMGKSVLVRHLQKQVTQQHGLFIAGKFEEQQQAKPYHNLIQGFRELILKILTETAIEVANWKTYMQKNLGKNADVITQVIPELEMIIGQQPAVKELAPRETQHRFNVMLRRFIRVFAQPKHPLVIFLDDVQWADTVSIQFLQGLMTDPDTKALLLVVGLRKQLEDDQCFAIDFKAEELTQQHLHLEKLQLSPLKIEHVEQLIADTLHCSLSHAHGLAELVHNKTNGTPFFVNEFLKSLYEESYLSFDTERKQWTWDVKKILGMSLTDNVVSMISLRMQKLLANTQNILKLAACIGMQFDVKTLALLNADSENDTVNALWEAVEENMVIPEGEGYQVLYRTYESDETINLDFTTVNYRFVHDRIQQAAYALLTEDEKQQAHYQLGRILRENTAPGQLDERLFDIVNHLNNGLPLINNLVERYDLARLNLSVGKKAKTSSAYDSALQYLQIGLSLLPVDSWQQQYHLSLTLHLHALEVAYLSHHAEIGDSLFKHILEHSHSILDQVKAYELKVAYYVSQSITDTALNTALQILELLNVKLPDEVLTTNELFIDLDKALKGRKIEDLTDSPLLKDQHKLAALRILLSISLLAYQNAPKLFPRLCYAQVKLCMDYGNSPLAAHVYAMYGFALCSMLQNLDKGYRYGQLALTLQLQQGITDSQARVNFLVASGILHWKEPLQNTLRFLEAAQQDGLDNGDLDYTCFASYYHSLYSFLSSELLDTVLDYSQHTLALLRKFNKDWHESELQLWQQCFAHLRQPSDDTSVLSGQYADEVTILPKLLAKADHSGLFSAYFAKAILAYLFKDAKSALTHAQTAKKYRPEHSPFFQHNLFLFYESLILLATYPLANKSQQETFLKQIHFNQGKLKFFASHCPANYQHKYDLVSAERARALGHVPQAMAAYEQALNGAKQQAFLMDEALANELAAEFYAGQGIHKVSHAYLRDAYAAYSSWGATAKVKALELRYPSLEQHSGTQTAKDLDRTLSANDSTLVNGVNLQGTDFFDLTTVVKASQAISSELVLEQLIKKFLQIVVENAGAQKGMVILERQGQFFIEAETYLDQHEVKVMLKSIALETRDKLSELPLLPLSLINYVARTRNHVVLHDAAHNGMFTNDEFISKTKPKSVLCYPLLYKNKLLGLLYLENNLISRAFTPERLTVLRLLSTQIAISIDNARFYAELAQAREAAEGANRAKSTFLMNMSHELRTPLNAILGYAAIIQEDAVDSGYQDILPDLDRIQTAGKQLLEILSNVLDISKIEADKMGLSLEVFDVADLIKEVVTVIQPTMSNDNTLTIECADDVGNMYADQQKIRQILLNLLSNANKFTRQGQITIRVTRHLTGVSSQEGATHWMEFAVTDTGIGMSAEQLHNIFEAFHQVDDSTTRQYGGTGLGLTISQHFCQMMGGKITVDSVLGEGSAFTVQLPLQVKEQGE